MSPLFFTFLPPRKKEMAKELWPREQVSVAMARAPIGYAMADT
jgi:hypothetical protein